MNINLLNYSHEVDVTRVFQPCIYALVDTNTESVKYIGQTNHVESRYYQHLIDARTSRNNLYNWISGLCSTGSLPKLFILEICEEDELLRHERHWIKLVNDGGSRLLNFGGKRCFFYSNEALSAIAKLFGGELITKNDVGHTSGETLLEWLCLNHGSFLKRASSVTSGQWCNDCTQIEVQSSGYNSKEIISRRLGLIEKIREQMLT
ncbi:GIY-YIG nuclease family protein [Vibrio mimicus]